MNRRHSFFLAFTGALLVSCLYGPASGREWTDSQGNRFEAVFLRFDEENAVLLRSGQMVTLPLSDLSNPDLRHLRRELELAGLGHLVPPLGSSLADEDDSPRKPASGTRSRPLNGFTSPPKGEPRVLDDQPLRVWTDNQGQKVNAKLLAIRDDGVVLLVSGKEFTVPSSRLSRSDQLYVERLEKSSVQADLVPSADLVASSSQPASPAGSPSSQPSMPSTHVWTPPVAGGGMEQLAGRMEEQAKRAEQGMEDSRRRMEEQAKRMEDEAKRQTDRMQELAQNAAEQAGASRTQPSHDMVAANTPSGFSAPSHDASPPSFREPPGYVPAVSPPSFPSSPLMEEVGQCSNCKKEVSADLGAGDRCPHCGVYFEYEESEFGQRTYAEGGSESSNSRLTGRGMRGLVKLGIFAVFGFLAIVGWLARQMTGE